jgi:hypothetical protein
MRFFNIAKVVTVLLLLVLLLMTTPAAAIPPDFCNYPEAPSPIRHPIRFAKHRRRYKKLKESLPALRTNIRYARSFEVSIH